MASCVLPLVMQGLSHKRFFFLSVCLFVVNLIFFSSDDKLILNGPLQCCITHPYYM